MSMLRQTALWTQQPQTIGRVNSGIPLTRELAGLWSAADNFSKATAQSELVLPTTATVRLTVAGKMIQFDGSTKASSATMTALKGNTTQPRTMLCVFSTGATTAGFDVVASFDNPAGEASLRIQANSAGTQIDAWDGTTTVTSPAFAANTVYCAVARQLGNTLDLWITGKKIASVGSTPIRTGQNRMHVGGYGSAGANWKGSVGLVGWWNRALSDAEIPQVSRNPGQLFAPQARVLWAVDTAGGGATAVVAAVDVMDTAAATAQAPARAVAAATDAPDTASANAKVTTTAVASATDLPDTASATAKATATAAASATDLPDTANATANATARAVAAATDTPDTCVASGGVASIFILGPVVFKAASSRHTFKAPSSAHTFKAPSSLHTFKAPSSRHIFKAPASIAN